MSALFLFFVLPKVMAFGLVGVERTFLAFLLELEQLLVAAFLTGARWVGTHEMWSQTTVMLLMLPTSGCTWQALGGSGCNRVMLNCTAGGTCGHSFWHTYIALV